LFIGLIEAEAVLSNRRNTLRGIKSRSRIISFLRVRTASTREISKHVKLSRSGTLYHLRLLSEAGTVIKRGRYWKARIRQRRIDSYL
jgi:predicted transcriptional regulator